MACGFYILTYSIVYKPVSYMYRGLISKYKATVCGGGGAASRTAAFSNYFPTLIVGDELDEVRLIVKKKKLEIKKIFL